MAAARRLPEGDRYVRDGHWQTWGPLLLLGPDVHGATLGIVGFGRIGQAVARRAQGFGMRILYHDVAASCPPSVTGPLGATYRAAGGAARRERFRVAPRQPQPGDAAPHQRANRWRWMKPTAVLVNTSRGPVVDQAALADGPARRRHLGGRAWTSPTPSRSRWTTRSSGWTTA